MLKLCQRSLFLIVAIVGSGFLVRNYYLNAAAPTLAPEKLILYKKNMAEFSAILGMIETATTPITTAIQTAFLKGSPTMTTTDVSTLKTNFNGLITLPSVVVATTKLKTAEDIKSRLVALHTSGLEMLITNGIIPQKSVDSITNFTTFLAHIGFTRQSANSNISSTSAKTTSAGEAVKTGAVGSQATKASATQPSVAKKVTR